MSLSATHLGFVLAAYGAAAAVVLALVLWTALRHRAEARALAAMEKRLGRGGEAPR
ncbi:MAG TPA: heme exporter protein CcmD [Hyphomicrobiales bacterium]|nr:heme exporter protein CcmD [Hyphomicrobiales bacterium]